MHGLQRNREELARADESAIEFFLDTIMSPTLLTEFSVPNEGSYLPLEHGKIGTTDTGVVVPLGVGLLCGAQGIPSLCQIYLPSHAMST